MYPLRILHQDVHQHTIHRRLAAVRNSMFGNTSRINVNRPKIGCRLVRNSVLPSIRQAASSVVSMHANVLRRLLLVTTIRPKLAS